MDCGNPSGWARPPALKQAQGVDRNGLVAELQEFDIGQRVRPLTIATLVGDSDRRAGAGVGDCKVCEISREAGSIRTGAAEQGVIAAASKDEVVVVIPINGVLVIPCG